MASSPSHDAWVYWLLNAFYILASGYPFSNAVAAATGLRMASRNASNPTWELESTVLVVSIWTLWRVFIKNWVDLLRSRRHLGAHYGVKYESENSRLVLSVSEITREALVVIRQVSRASRTSLERKAWAAGGGGGHLTHGGLKKREVNPTSNLISIISKGGGEWNIIVKLSIENH